MTFLCRPLSPSCSLYFSELEYRSRDKVAWECLNCGAKTPGRNPDECRVCGHTVLESDVESTRDAEGEAVTQPFDTDSALDQLSNDQSNDGERNVESDSVSNVEVPDQRKHASDDVSDQDTQPGEDSGLIHRIWSLLPLLDDS